MCHSSVVEAFFIHSRWGSEHYNSEGLSGQSTSIWQCQVRPRIPQSIPQPMGHSDYSFWGHHHKLFWWFCGNSWWTWGVIRGTYSQGSVPIVGLEVCRRWPKSSSFWETTDRLRYFAWCEWASSRLSPDWQHWGQAGGAVTSNNRGRWSPWTQEARCLEVERTNAICIWSAIWSCVQALPCMCDATRLWCWTRSTWWFNGQCIPQI